MHFEEYLPESEEVSEHPISDEASPAESGLEIWEEVPWQLEIEPEPEVTIDDQGDVVLELVTPSEEPVANQGSIGGTVASVLLHLSILFLLATWTLPDRKPLTEPPLETRMEVAKEEEEPEEPIEYELTNPQDRELEVRKVVHAASVGQLETQKPKPESAPQPLSELINKEVQPVPYDIPEGQMVDERLVVKGTTGEGLIELESALDRITWEIANNLQSGKVLVVWLLDASGSLSGQREAIAKRLNRVYGELDALDREGQLPRLDQPLLSAVVSYGLKTNYLTGEPTADFDEILQAVENVPVDESGVENVFTAVSQVMGKWSSYRTTHGRQIMLITVTDESGDDFAALELAIKRCRMYGAKSYVVGPAAVFGRRQGYVNYTAPEDSEVYQLPVDVGPEVPMIFNLRLPFWHNGPNYEYLSSGFGPYGLSRMVMETGGIYFMTHMTTTETLTPVGVYEGQNLKPFEPDYQFSTPEQYLADISKHPLRLAVYRAAVLSEQQKIGAMPPLDFQVTPQNYRDVAAKAQQDVAVMQYQIETILSAFPPNVEQYYETEPSLRWRMSFNLAYGRLLAQLSRCHEYNALFAEIKGSLTPEDISTKSNHWILQPAAQLKYGLAARKQEKKARELLQRVLDEAPGSPWAVLAARELKDPMGLQMIHRFIPPPEPRQSQANNAPNRPGIRLAPDPQPKAPPAKPPAPKPKPVLPRL